MNVKRGRATGIADPMTPKGLASMHDAVYRRFASKTAVATDLSPNGMAGCILWTAAKHPHGYGHFWLDGSMRYAHIVAYERAVGPVPLGLELDHLCRRRGCVNTAHLEAVTHAENMRRAGEARVVATHCQRGHEFTAENTYVTPRGRRNCRKCLRIAGRKFDLKRYGHA